LRSWDFSGQDLTDADLSGSLTGVNLSGAMVTGASLKINLTEEQLYSTASYQMRNLQGIDLSRNNLSGWDFSGQDVSGASFANTTSHGFTKEQLYSTASYQQKNLRSIGLWDNDLTGWDFIGQDLTYAHLDGATLTDANLTGAIVTGATFSSTTSRGFTKEQFYSTASYREKELQGIQLTDNDLSGWDFSGQDLSHAQFGYCFWWEHECIHADSNLDDVNLAEVNLTEASLSGASLRNANLSRADLTGIDLRCCRTTTMAGANLTGTNFKDVDLSRLALDSAIYNQWTVFPEDYDTTADGLIFVETPVGDFDMDDVLDADDIDVLAQRIRLGYVDSNGYWNDAMFDVNGDSTVDQEDHRAWIVDLKMTWFGDANLDLEFNSSDMVQVFVAGKYEIGKDASWNDGDWNGDGIFDSGDLVIGLSTGCYEGSCGGPRPRPSVAVPEPSGWLLLLLAGMSLLSVRHRL
jgi:uncharacterized protein YjbI with pentapeptide repeats